MGEEDLRPFIQEDVTNQQLKIIKYREKEMISHLLLEEKKGVFYCRDFIKNQIRKWNGKEIIAILWEIFEVEVKYGNEVSIKQK